jgi:hypothetical protein
MPFSSLSSPGVNSVKRHFVVKKQHDLPALAFAAEVVAGRPAIAVVCGPAVEIDDKGVIAGAWAGSFEQGAIEQAASSVGTALKLAPEGLLAVAGTASASQLYFCRAGPRLIVANILALALAMAEDRLITSHPFYPQDLFTFIFGSHRYKHTVATERGWLSIFYGSMLIAQDGALHPATVNEPPPFADFAAYRSYLVTQTQAILANAADPLRQCRYRSIVALSAGYDSPAAAVIARDAGCSEAITFGQPVDQPDASEDSGGAIARALGLTSTEYNTFAFRERRDLPEVEFIASSFGGGQVYLAATGDALAGRIVISGYGGDTVWSMRYGEHAAPRFPFYIGGYSHNEFYARAPALDLSVPVIGARRFADIGKISRSAAMLSWSVGGDYDRPIPRRILEEAGIPRGAFATRKRRITPDYDTVTRRAIDLDRFLSPTSRAAFEAWLAKEQPINRFRAQRHRLLTDSIGRILWSGKLSRALWRLGVSWPPFPARILNLKVPIRKNAFVFNWAVSQQVARYSAMLARKTSPAGADGSLAPPEIVKT